MKKIVFLAFFSVFIFSSQLSLAETYPATCDSTAQAIISGIGGCSAIDCNTYSIICAKCCVSSTQTQACASFSYSNWSACQSSGTQTRTVVSKSPTGCTGGTPITSQSCVPTIALPVSTSATSTSTALISTFTSSKTEIVSGENISLAFSGPNTIGKYQIYFSCPKFSTGLNSGLLATSAKIGEVEYCNKDLAVPANTKTQNVNISSKYSKSLKLTIRLKAYNSQDQYVDYKDVIMTVQPSTASTVATALSATSTSISIPTTTSTTIPATSASTIPTGTSLQEQINILLDQIKVLQQQLLSQQSSLTTMPSSVAPTSSTASAPPSESITETTLSNESKIFSYTWNKDLYYGMRNSDDVKALQRALAREGVYFEEITGNFFGLTKQAVIAFQKKHNFTNLPGTGYVGPYTRKVLNELYSK